MRRESLVEEILRKLMGNSLKLQTVRLDVREKPTIDKTALRKHRRMKVR